MLQIMRCDRCGVPLYAGDTVLRAFGGVYCHHCRHGAIDDRLRERGDRCSLCGEVAEPVFYDEDEAVCDHCRVEYIMGHECIL